MEKSDIMSFSADETATYINLIGEKSFRAKQIFIWMQKGIDDFDKMTNIPKPLRDTIKNDCFITSCKPKKIQSSSDGTRKYLFELYDGEKIESVFMKYKYGNTVCISTQAGCRMGCSFCASTLNGLKRNLLPSEMLWQIIAAQNDTGEKVSHV
ncbi:MAG: 23S rRNA (adenine(2503)-C(2))-methyltransferase RlmN, partial [Clostridia bacterium]